MKNKPLYIQLWEKYRNSILEGKYNYGELFSTERELEKVHSCDRKTIRKALNMLVDEQLLVRIVGKGTYVNKPDLRLQLESIQGFSGLLRQQGIEITNKVLFFQKVEAGYRVAKMLQIDKEDTVYKCIRLRYAKESPVAVETTYIRDIFPDLLKFDFNIYSLYEVMGSYGQFPEKVKEEITAVELPETEAQYLGKTPGDIAYLITDITRNKEGQIIEYNRSYTVSERFEMYADLI